MEWCCRGCRRAFSTSPGRQIVPAHECHAAGEFITLIAPTKGDPERVWARTKAIMEKWIPAYRKPGANAKPVQEPRHRERDR